MAFRFTIDPVAKTSRRTTILAQSCDFPRLNPKHRCDESYRWVTSFERHLSDAGFEVLTSAEAARLLEDSFCNPFGMENWISH